MYIWIIALFAIPALVLTLYKLFGNEAKQHPLNVILMASAAVVAIYKRWYWLAGIFTLAIAWLFTRKHRYLRRGLYCLCLVLALLFAGSLVQTYMDYRISEARLETAAEDFFAELQTLTPETATDFLPKTTENGWTYFFAVDEHSVYRISADTEEPELVAEDCAGAVQLVDGNLYFHRNNKNAASSTFIRMNLSDGTQEQVACVTSLREMKTITEAIVGEFLVSFYSSRNTSGMQDSKDPYLRIKPLDTGSYQSIKLTINNENIQELLWTDGAILYYIAFDGELNRWDFSGIPEPVALPDGSTYWDHSGSTILAKDWSTGDIYEYDCAAAQWTWYSVGSNTGSCRLYVAPDGRYYEATSETLQLLGTEQTELNPAGYHEILYLDASRMIYANTDYHSQYETCGCGAEYWHYVLQTRMVRRKSGIKLWNSSGNYVLDY